MIWKNTGPTNLIHEYDYNSQNDVSHRGYFQVLHKPQLSSLNTFKITLIKSDTSCENMLSA